MDALANEMADCWWQFGEGKLDYAGGWDIAENAACSVCSIVDFGSNILKGEKITYEDFYQHLQEKEKSSSQTYLNYLYKTSIKEDLGEYLENEIDLSKEYFILTALREKGGVYERAEPIAAFFWDVTFGMGILGLFDITSSDGENGEKRELESLPVVILKKDKTNLDSLNCGEFVTKS